MKIIKRRDNLNPFQINENLWWVGTQDHEIKVFDIIMVTKYGTSYNSYIYKTSEGYVLFETTKVAFFDEYIQKLKAVVGDDLSQIKYLLTNHTEPDHAGSIEKLLKLIPSIKVIGSRNALEYLSEITNNHTFKSIEAIEGKDFKFGGKTFQFLSVPMLHWPDSIYTYIKEDKLLVTCDSFGSHYAFDGILLSNLPKEKFADYEDACLYYYTCIFAPFKPFVNRALEKIAHLSINLITPGHGPVLDTKINWVLKKYKEWSKLPDVDPKKIVITYCTAYGYTEQMAETIEKGIKAINKDFKIKKYHIHALNFESEKPKIMEDITTSSGLLLGSPTINGDALPLIFNILNDFFFIETKSKIGAAFGSYGWSGEATRNVSQRLKQLNFQTMKSLSVRFKPSNDQLKECFEFGKTFGQSILSGKIKSSNLASFDDAGTRTLTLDEFTKKFNPTKELATWRCNICNAEFNGIKPPMICPVCNVSYENFVLVDEIKNKIEKINKKMHVVVIGGGIASVSAIKVIRNSNDLAKITLISEEDTLPYNRPLVSDVLGDFNIAKKSDFLILNDAWYKKNNIEIILNTPVKAIDFDKKTIQTLKTKFTYDKLIIATGAKPVKENIPGFDAHGVFNTRNVKDVLLANKIIFEKKLKNIVIYGAGEIGMEAATSLWEHHENITMLEYMPRILVNNISNEFIPILEKDFNAKGVKFITNARLKEIVKNQDGWIKGIKLDNQEISADAMLVSSRTFPNNELFKNTKLKCDDFGIVANEKMETNIKDVYVAGDVSSVKSHRSPRLWAIADMQGRIAGSSVLGLTTEYSTQFTPVVTYIYDNYIVAMGSYKIDPKELKECKIFKNLNIQNGYHIIFDKDKKIKYALAVNDKELAQKIISRTIKVEDF